MIGLIHTILLGCVEELLGEEGVDNTLLRAGMPEDMFFRMDTVYPDDEWQRLFNSAVVELGVSNEEAEIQVADFFYRDAYKRWPKWFQMSHSTREFLLRQPKIHNGFAAGVEDIQDRQRINDKFRLIDAADSGSVVIYYQSPNRLCGLYKALARCLMAHYQDPGEIKESTCMHKGDKECCIQVSWP